MTSRNVMSGLTVAGLTTHYGMHQALHGVDLNVAADEIVVILGANGAGKSTLLKAIAGSCEGRCTGEVTLQGENLMGLDAAQIVTRGIAFVPEGRGIFGDLSVHENLLLGAYTEHARMHQERSLEQVLTLFPKLLERKRQIARTMSGGEQQMVAIGRALMSAPSILMLDEPSLGLSPLLCKELFTSLKQVRDSGVGILLVEQNAKQSLGIADRGYLLENGSIVGQDNASNLLHDPAVQAAYLGGTKAGQGHRSTSALNSARSPAMPTSSVDTSPQRQPSAALAGEDIDTLVARAASLSGDREKTTTGQNTPALSIPETAGDSQVPVYAQRGNAPRTTVINPGPVALDGSDVTSTLSTSTLSTSPVSTSPRAASPSAAQATLHNAGSDRFNGRDPEIERLLAEFETAARKAAGRQADGMQAAGSGEHRAHPSSSDSGDQSRQYSSANPEPESLPVIPVYRKSPVTVYRRDGEGKLRKQE